MHSIFEGVARTYLSSLSHMSHMSLSLTFTFI